MNKYVVHTTNGSIRGIPKLSILHTEYISFQKIPYAQPPIGKLRFRDPQPVQNWTHILDATAEGPACWNYDAGLQKSMGDEDCLHLNIFTKIIQGLKPVMVFLHGGAFMFGSSSVELHSPDYFMQKDIVLVTLNYRLGAFGFLSIDNPAYSVPGNAGLKDQAMALRWIKENIEHFGGNPNNITLFGESAGSASVHYHLLSNLSRHLFHKAILMSGYAFNHWALVNAQTMTDRLATKLGWTGDGSIIDYLQSVDAKDITSVQLTLLSNEEQRKQIHYPFGPCSEPYISEQCIISDDYTSDWGNTIPILIGCTSDEGLYLRKLAINDPQYLTDARDHIEFIVPNAKEKSEQIAEFYFPNREVTLSSYLNLVSDKWFLHGMHKTLQLRIQSSPSSAATYLYRFNVDLGDFNHFKTIMCGRGVKGTCHADNLSYLFKNKFVTSLNEDQLNAIQNMIGIWTQFSETGNPNDAVVLNEIQWDPVTSTESCYKCLNISKELKVIDYPEWNRMEFWDSL